MFIENTTKNVENPGLRSSTVIKPMAPNTLHRKHLGYYCTKCDADKRLNVMRLCRCLDLEEDPKKVKWHINTHWAPLYADMELLPPRLSSASFR